MLSLKQVIVNAPPELREELQPLSRMALINRCAGLRPGQVTTILASSKYTLRAIARRWQQLNDEINGHEKLLTQLTTQAAPDLSAAFAVGPDTAAEMLIVAGDNPDRIRSEPAFAKLCGVAPIPTSSGKTTRHRLNRGGHRQANAALYRVVIVRMQHHEPTKAYVSRRTAEGKTKAEIIRCLKDCSPANSGPPCDPSAQPDNPSRQQLDGYRSINALMESFWGSMQIELLDRRTWPTRAALASAMFEWIEAFYNPIRRHSALDYQSAIEYERLHTTADPAA